MSSAKVVFFPWFMPENERRERTSFPVAPTADLPPGKWIEKRTFEA
jgi:hypothetical protein